MCARRYTKIQHLLPVIEEMIAAGKTHKEKERELGLKGDQPVHKVVLFGCTWSKCDKRKIPKSLRFRDFVRF